MTQIDDNRDQQVGMPRQPHWAPQGQYPGAPSGPWQQPMAPQQYMAPPPAPYPAPQGYWQWQPGAPAPVVVQQVARPTNGAAIFALIMSLLWIGGIGSLIGLIVGISAAKDCDAKGEQGHGMATAAALLGFAGLFFSFVMFVST